MKWQNQFRNKSLLILTDNATVIAYVRNQGGTKSMTLTSAVRKLLQWQFQYGSDHKTYSRVEKCVGRQFILNKKYPSIRVDASQRNCSSVVQYMGSPITGLICNKKNCQVPNYVSPFPDSEAVSQDGLSIAWKDTLNYAFPHSFDPSGTPETSKGGRGELILIAPCWQTQYWFPQLLALVVDLPRKLPLWKKLLSQG